MSCRVMAHVDGEMQSLAPVFLAGKEKQIQII
jgi:hypothetical protein